MPEQRTLFRSRNELKGWKDQMVEMRVDIDIQFGIILRIDLAWTKSEFQSREINIAHRYTFL